MCGPGDGRPLGCGVYTVVRQRLVGSDVPHLSCWGCSGTRIHRCGCLNGLRCPGIRVERSCCGGSCRQLFRARRGRTLRCGVIRQRPETGRSTDQDQQAPCPAPVFAAAPAPAGIQRARDASPRLGRRRGLRIVQALPEEFVNGVFSAHCFVPRLVGRCGPATCAALSPVDFLKCFRHSPAGPRSPHGRTLRWRRG